MYVHRVGRTGRIAGQEGSAFVFIDPDNPNDQQLTEFLTDVRKTILKNECLLFLSLAIAPVQPSCATIFGRHRT